MKISVMLILFAVAATAALHRPSVTQSPCEKMAQQVIVALRQTSPEGYVALFPSLAEFHNLMDENADVYG
jgi:hypothetical protein